MRRVALSSVAGVAVAIDAALVARILDQDANAATQESTGPRLRLADLWGVKDVAEAGRVVELEGEGTMLRVTLGEQVRLLDVEASAVTGIPELLAPLAIELAVGGLVRLEDGTFAFLLSPALLAPLAAPHE